MATAKLVVASLCLLVVLTQHEAAAAASKSCHGGRAAGMVEAMFVFGSSLVDNGNNNFLNGSRAVRADYLPYGVDFPLGPTGRFSNGRNTIDALGELLLLPAGGRIPTFADPATRGRAALHGVNFASGGSGILDDTGKATGEVLSLEQQITNFEAVTLPNLRAQLQRANDRKKMKGHDFFDRCYLPKSLFVIGSGGNDYLLNYFRPRNSEETRPDLSDFTRALVARLSAHLQRLYALGARKFAIFSIQPIGCSPVVRASLNVTAAVCVKPVNAAALLFNSELRSLVDAAGPSMPGASFSVIDSYKITMDVLDHPMKHGITETYKPCCSEMGPSGVLCRKGGPICSDRNEYLFFDGLHPTDVVNAWISRKGYGSVSPEEAYPINVKMLAML
ncbi:GDSL esterase/lipase At1g29670 [Lolium perenne]|uniref:GDSL esterase/lipase At1g29670 n=1 Tax=Lolium perenne TaxID=4522 RepID=UPI0021EAA198|nr:GDSL esterase/lipase At1g29670-like [Lolium perenne]